MFYYFFLSSNGIEINTSTFKLLMNCVRDIGVRFFFFQLLENILNFNESLEISIFYFNVLNLPYFYVYDYLPTVIKYCKLYVSFALTANCFQSMAADKNKRVFVQLMGRWTILHTG